MVQKKAIMLLRRRPILASVRAIQPWIVGTPLHGRLLRRHRSRRLAPPSHMVISGQTRLVLLDQMRRSDFLGSARHQLCSGPHIGRPSPVMARHRRPLASYATSHLFILAPALGPLHQAALPFGAPSSTIPRQPRREEQLSKRLNKVFRRWSRTLNSWGSCCS